MVRHALTTLYHADQRVDGFGESKHAATRYPAFSVKTTRGERSRPTALARTHRAAPRRPRALRGHGRPRPHVQLGRPRGDELGPDAVQRLGVDKARRQALAVRTAILEAYGQNGPAGGQPYTRRHRAEPRPRDGPAP
jgi:hypothetical protein